MKTARRKLRTRLLITTKTAPAEEWQAAMGKLAIGNAANHLNFTSKLQPSRVEMQPNHEKARCLVRF